MSANVLQMARVHWQVPVLLLKSTTLALASEVIFPFTSNGGVEETSLLPYKDLG